MTITRRLEGLTKAEVSAEIVALDAKNKEDKAKAVKKHRSTRKRLVALERVLQEEQGEPEGTEEDEVGDLGDE